MPPAISWRLEARFTSMNNRTFRTHAKRRFPPQPLGSVVATATVIFVLISPAAAQRDPIRLTHGAMPGKPKAHSMAAWGRTSESSQFTVRLGMTDDRLDQISKPATTTIEHDNTSSLS
jgi:hypothetical protein